MREVSQAAGSRSAERESNMGEDDLLREEYRGLDKGLSSCKR